MIVFLIVQVAFKTGDYKQEVIFIGGLTDGFLTTEYVFTLLFLHNYFDWSEILLIPKELMSQSFFAVKMR